MPNTHTDFVKQLAQQGAKARLVELEQERIALLKIFPTLRLNGQPTPVASPTTAPAPKRYKLSAAQRKAIGQRMKKYWAARRQQQAAKNASK